MVYVDVTSACLLPLQSGIPRTTRGIYSLLQRNIPNLQPLTWQPFFWSYTELSSHAKKLLHNPFPSTGKRHSTPKDWLLPLLWASFQDACTHPKSWSMRKSLTEKDTLFVTSLFPDNRLPYLRKHLLGPGRKVVLFHDAIPLLDQHVPTLGKKLHESMLRLMSEFDLVICVSQSAQTHLNSLWKERGIRPTKTQALNWPVPFTSERPAYTLPALDKKKVLYVARLKRMKNHSTLLVACEKLWKNHHDFTLELIGCEDVPMESRELLKKINELKKSGFPVLWRGHVSDAELHAAYQSCTFTVFPSLMEGFGLPIVESLWHGRPVLCGSSGAIGEVSQGAGTIPVDVTDSDSLASSIKQLLDDPKRCQTLAEEAYQRPVRTWADYWRELEPLL